MIINCQKRRPYKKFMAGETTILKAGDVCQVCIMGEEIVDLGAGRCQMMAYSLAEVLGLREREGMLEGHPLLDLGAEEGVACGYLELTTYQAAKIKEWEAAGDLVGVRNYSRKPGAKDHQVQRIRRQKMIRGGLLTAEDMIWLNNICQISHYYVETEMAKLELNFEAGVKQPPSPESTPPQPKRPPKRHPRRKTGLSRKERRRLEQEEGLYGSLERIGAQGKGAGSNGVGGQR